jgi:hypothetical protein
MSSDRTNVSNIDISMHPKRIFLTNFVSATTHMDPHTRLKSQWGSVHNARGPLEQVTFNKCSGQQWARWRNPTADILLKV